MPSHEGTVVHLANTTELALPSAHPSPQPKWQIDQFSHFLHSSRQKVPIVYKFTMRAPLSPNLTLPMRRPGPHPTRESLGASEPTTQTAFRSVQPFFIDDRIVSLYFTMGRLFHLKITPSHGGSGPHLVHGSLGPPESSTQTAS